MGLFDRLPNAGERDEQGEVLPEYIGAVRAEAGLRHLSGLENFQRQPFQVSNRYLMLASDTSLLIQIITFHQVLLHE